jgi:hypothetical protein
MATSTLAGIPVRLCRRRVRWRFTVPLADTCAITLDTGPIGFTSPVTTALPDTMDADAEETDDSTLGLFNAEDEETDGPA